MQEAIASAGVPADLRGPRPQPPGAGAGCGASRRLGGGSTEPVGPTSAERRSRAPVRLRAGDARAGAEPPASRDHARHLRLTARRRDARAPVWRSMERRATSLD
jgi:hypothetical protein